MSRLCRECVDLLFWGRFAIEWERIFREYYSFLWGKPVAHQEMINERKTYLMFMRDRIRYIRRSIYQENFDIDILRNNMDII